MKLYFHIHIHKKSSNAHFKVVASFMGSDIQKRLQLNRMQEQEQFKFFFYDKNKFYNEKDACIILLPSEVQMRKRSLHIVVGQNGAVLTHNKIENFTQN